MKRKIFKNLCLTALITVILSCLLITVVYYTDFQSRMRLEVRTEAGYIKSGLELAGTPYLQAMQTTQNRITLIKADGTVLYDSYTAPDAMENHGSREEVKEALTGGAGESVRLSGTLGKQTYYYALKLSGGDVLRVASVTDTVFTELLGLSPWILLAALLAVAFSSLFSRFLTRRVVAPINNLDLDHPADNVVYDEISPLLSRIHRQNEVIKEQIRSLQEKQAEFNSITENMTEGFLVIDNHTDILSYNSGALRLLGTEALPKGRHESALTLNRSAGFRCVVDLALSGEKAEQLLTINGKSCQIMANPVRREGEVVGAVIVILDVTEREERENLRREFTANVSHELKTPLTSISGFAEIIQNGIARTGDIPRFAGKIYDEARRLISLVDDIIKLSRLDEEALQPQREGAPRWEPIDLPALCRDTAGRLDSAAKAANVTFSVTGEHTVVTGVRSIIEEMVFNLCDNAVKYNRPGGKVFLSVKEVPDGVALCVSDTGIGIPPADRDRVFERFYRVDKSHSSEIGGTGLGLSIVKHGAAFHKVALSLESTEDVGTTVTIVFPKSSPLSEGTLSPE